MIFFTILLDKKAETHDNSCDKIHSVILFTLKIQKKIYAKQDIEQNGRQA